MFKISNYIVKTEIPSEEDILDVIIFSTRTGNMIVLKKEIFNNLEKSDFENIDFRVLNLLLKYKILVLSDEKEISTILEEKCKFYFDVLGYLNQNSKMIKSIKVF